MPCFCLDNEADVQLEPSFCLDSEAVVQLVPSFCLDSEAAVQLGPSSKTKLFQNFKEFWEFIFIFAIVNFSLIDVKQKFYKDTF